MRLLGTFLVAGLLAIAPFGLAHADDADVADDAYSYVEDVVTEDDVPMEEGSADDMADDDDGDVVHAEDDAGDAAE